MAFLEQESSPFALTFFWKIHSRNNKLIQEMSRFRIRENNALSIEVSWVDRYLPSIFLPIGSIVRFNGMLYLLTCPVGNFLVHFWHFHLQPIFFTFLEVSFHPFPHSSPTYEEMIKNWQRRRRPKRSWKWNPWRLMCPGTFLDQWRDMVCVRW